MEPPDTGSVRPAMTDGLTLERVAYWSVSTRPEMALATLADVLASSARNNARDDLTGVLLISEGRFFQVLEGSRQDLDRTLSRIEQDPRHQALTVVSRERASHRLFGQWAMVAATVTPHRRAAISEAISRSAQEPHAAIAAARFLLKAQLAA